jgi:hypothetical protein
MDQCQRGDIRRMEAGRTRRVHLPPQVVKGLEPTGIYTTPILKSLDGKSGTLISISEASAFFEGGSIGYSKTNDLTRLDGLQLKTLEWRVNALEVETVYSNFYADHSRFPEGSVVYDHTLIMRDIEHEWHKVEDLYTVKV